MLTNLKKLRIQNKLSQQELADRLGISQQSINKYENHNVQPDFHTLIAIADFFHTSVDYLIGNNAQYDAVFSETTITLSAEEMLLLTQYRNLTTQQKKCLEQLLETWKK